MANGDASNNSSKENTIDMKLRYEISESNTWSSTVSAKLGVQTTIQTGIPLIAEGKIEMSAEFSGEYTWGKTKSKSSEIETVYTVTVPPMSRVRVSLLATKGQCDVPYSYTQRDTLMNGDQVTNYYDDGIYTAVNCYNFKYETKQEPL
ncbi:natterin-1-like [Cucurbita pepo subsp. pepo]|nr:natterin-1-like [Cucurbita pepo subsp. pepo]